MNDAEIRAAWSRLEERWPSDGSCNYRSFHGSLEEYDVQDLDIEPALRGDGWLHLACRNRREDDIDDHRGVKIYPGGQQP